jgi:hypothetical protein
MFKHTGPCTVFALPEIGFGISASHSKLTTIEVKPYAQHRAALFVFTMAPRARKYGRGWVRTPTYLGHETYGNTFPSVVVVEGIHDAPDPYGPYRQDGTCKVREGLFPSCDPRWETLLRDHVKSLGARVLFDSAEVTP